MKHSMLWVSALAMTSAVAVSTASAMQADPADLVLDEAPAESPEGMTLAAQTDPSASGSYGLEVKKTAETKFERKWKWELDKYSETTQLYLAHGEYEPVEYMVTAGTDGYEDWGWSVSGEIRIANKTYQTATITDVVDVITSQYDPAVIYAKVTCPVYFPHYLKPGEHLKCTYYAALPDGKERKNTATVKTKGYVEGGSAYAPVKFTYPKKEVDRCANVHDDTGETYLGYVCAEEAPKTFKLWMNVGPYYTCGEHYFTNYASLVTKDTYATESASHTITVKVKCDGCTRTQGYWKTHSKYGPAAKPDATWNLIGENTPFFKSGKTWYEILTMPPKGSAYIILAHQYIAALLNAYAGADTSYVKDELEYAKKFFEYTKLSDSLSSQKRDEVLSWANILDKYNNGLMGADHCE